VRLTFLTFLILGLYIQIYDCHAQCITIENWSQNKDGIRTLCFYPTTLRMVNVNRDKGFNEMVKDIKKLKIMLVDVKKANFKKEDVSTLTKGIRAELFKDMIQFQRGKQSIYIFVKEVKEKPVAFSGIIFSDDQLILIDLKGWLSPASIRQIIEGKMNFGAVSKIIDLTGKQDQKHDPHEKIMKK
jgi:hypothetical protein